MQIDRRFTNGLAWAGVFIIVGVPVADLVSAQLLEPATERAATVTAPATPPAPVPRPAAERPRAPAVEVAATKPTSAPEPEVEPEAVEVAAVEPAKPAAQPKPTSASTDPVASYVQSGKPLPSYISDGGNEAPAAAAVTTPAATQPSAPAKPVAEPVEDDPITVAAVPEKPVPFPMPLSMRPTPQTAPTFGVAPAVAATPATGAPPLIIPDTVVAPVPPVEITAADLEDWESGPLSEFLARRQGNASAYVEPAPRRDRLVAPADDFYFFPFGD